MRKGKKFLGASHKGGYKLVNPQTEMRNPTIRDA